MNKEEQIRNLQKKLMQENENKVVGEQRDIVVYINHGYEDYNISFIQQIESVVDEALKKMGFSKSKTIKGDIQELVYWQFAQSLNK